MLQIMAQCNVIEGAIIGRHIWNIRGKERKISDDSILLQNLQN
jgi:hypothetical protein